MLFFMLESKIISMDSWAQINIATFYVYNQTKLHLVLLKCSKGLL